MNKFDEKIAKYLEALIEAEAKSKEEFTCPLCGGKAWWARSRINNHLRSKCEQCGFAIIQ